MANTVYKTGYLVIDPNEGISIQVFNTLKRAKSYCEYLVVGIPNDNLIGRMCGSDCTSHFSSLKEIFLSLPIVSDVFEINWNTLSKIAVWEQIHYNICFVGSIYGRQFYEDKKILYDRGVELLLLESESKELDYDALREALKDASFKRKIILFGTGAYFDAYMRKFGDTYKPLLAIDNDRSKWGMNKSGVKIGSPDRLSSFLEDDVLIVICSKKYEDILRQVRGISNFDFRTIPHKTGLAVWSEYELSFQEEDSYLKESHRQLKILLREFDRVCTKYKLEYYLICGSLIGAIRHKDLIPWDDDADVAMTRENYEQLKKHADEIWTGTDFTFLPYNRLGNNTFLDFMNRLVYQKESIPTNIFYRVKNKIKADVCDHQVLDIYVLDNASDNEGVHSINCIKQKLLYGLAMGHRGKIDMSLYKNTSAFIQFSVYLLSHLGKIIPLKFIFALYEHHCKKYNRKNTFCYYESNGWIGFFNHKIRKELLTQTCRLTIGDVSVMAPKQYDEFLEELGYHNYMTYPPDYERIPKHSAKSELIL